MKKALKVIGTAAKVYLIVDAAWVVVCYYGRLCAYASLWSYNSFVSPFERMIDYTIDDFNNAIYFIKDTLRRR